MTTLGLEYDINGVRDRLTTLECALDDPTPFSQDALLLMIRSTQKTFQMEGRPRWDDLAPSTIRRRFPKAMKGNGAKKLGSLGSLGSIRILQDTGLLLQSVGGGANGPFSAAGGSGAFDKAGATITTNNPGAWNQFPNARTGAPARIIFDWYTEDQEDLLAMANDYVLGLGPYA